VWSDFQVLDYWGDGSLLLVDLPGHADGHFGFVLNGTDRPEFYIVDACWHVQVMKDQLPLPWISRRFQHDPAAYFETQRKLNRLAVRTEIELLACHCPRTLDRVV
jgi:glyoxylase-like metal-dependent hydrolase (beta-lactamase superfamily II)